MKSGARPSYPHRLAIALTVMIVGASPLVAQSYWQGTLQYEGRVWDIGLRFDPAQSQTAPLLDMAALYLAGAEPDTFAYHGDRLVFALPWEMGRFDGELSARGIAGTVTLSEGGTVPLHLQPSTYVPVRTEAVRFHNGDVTIAGTLALPDGPGPFPLITVLHGGGDSTRENHLFWADWLPRHGFACLIYDKRGNGASTGDWRTVGFEARARDLIAGLDLLRTRSDIDPRRIGLLAFSQGSWVAGLLADLYPGVAFIAHVSGPAVPVVEADTYSIVSELRRERWSPEAIAERVALWHLSSDVTREPDVDERWQQLQDAVDAVRDRDWFAEAPYKPSRTSWFRTWYRLVLDHDPRLILQRLSIPMLWVYGERDSESDAIRNVAILHHLRREHGKPYRVEVFPAAGHGLLVPVDGDGRDLPPLTIAPGLLNLLAEWLQEQAEAKAD